MEILDTGADLNAKVKPSADALVSAPRCRLWNLPQQNVARRPIGCRFPTGMTGLCSRYAFNEYATSARIYAIK